MSYPPIRIRCCKAFSRVRKSFLRVQREAPIVIEIFAAVCILCLLLIADILWLGATHRREISILKESHINDIGKFRKQFDTQVHQVDYQHQVREKNNVEEHNQEVDKMKVRHQQELERKISGIQEELNNLMSLSKTYWEQHAENHNRHFIGQDNKKVI